MSSFAQNQLAAGDAVSQGIYSYYQGKSQAQLAKKDPKAFVAYKRQQAKFGFIFFLVFIGLVILGLLIWLIVYLTTQHKKKDDDNETTSNASPGLQ